MNFYKMAFCLVTIAAATPASAASIVTNGSFESTTVPSSPGYDVAPSPQTQAGNPLITDWGIHGGPDAGEFIGGTAGSQAAFIDAGATLYQDLGALAPNTTYTLTLAAAQTGDQPAQVGTLTESLAFGTGNVNADINTGALTTGNSAAVIPVATFAPLAPLTFTTGSSVSGDLFVLLALSATGPGSGRTPQVYVDNVAVSATTVPEPATMTLLGISALALLAGRRRRSL